MHQMFFQHIIDNIHSPAAFQIYADWLIDQGDPFGRFIAAQLRLETATDRLTRARAFRTARKLLRRHYRRWLEPWNLFDLDDPDLFYALCAQYIYGKNVDCVFKRGLPNFLDLSELNQKSAHFLLYSPYALTLQELVLDQLFDIETDEQHQRYVQFLRAGQLQDILESARPLPNLKKLCIGGGRSRYTNFHHATAEIVALTPHLEELTLRGHHLGLSRLIPNLPSSLKRLDLTIDPNMQDPANEWADLPHLLMNSPSLQSLTSLHLESFYTDDDVPRHQARPLLEAILHSPFLTKITDLRLDDLTVTNDDFLDLMVAPIFHQLTHLDLSCNNLDDGLENLLNQPLDRPPLQSLILSHNDISEDCGRRLQALPVAHEIET